MKSLFVALALVGWSSAASADVNTDSAQQFMALCAQRLPETRQTVQLLKDEGWRYESTDGSFHVYSRNGRRVIAATSVTSSPQQGCMSAVSKLNKAGAIALGSKLAAQLGFQLLKSPPPGSPPGTLAVWVGRVNSVKAGIVAYPPQSFYVMRGAGIVLLTE